MSVLKIAVPLVALLIGSWLCYDGLRACQKGDYTTPSSGPHAGQLGPWTRVVSLFGVDPRGMLMKTVHVALGVFWLTAAFYFVTKPHLGWMMLVVCSISSLWYLPIGTVLATVELILLFLPQIKNLR